MDERTGDPGIEGNGRAERVKDMAREANAQVEHAKLVFDDLNTRAVTFIRERPGTAIVAALALGYIVGKLASSRS